jgi:hypothetical protein
MATIVRYVNTASSAGGDGTTNNTSGATRAYATLSAAEAALRQTLTGVTNDVNDQDGNNTISLRIYVSGSSADSTAVNFNNASWVTDATHRIEIIRFDTNPGSKWDSSVYRLEAAPGYGVGTLTIGTAIHMDLVNLQVGNTTGVDNAPIALNLGNFAWDVRIYGGFYRNSGTSGTFDGPTAIAVQANATFSLKIRNATMVGADGAAFTAITYTNAAATAMLYNCTLINRSATNRTVFTTSNFDTGTTTRFKNLLIQGTTGATNNYVATTPDEATSILTQDTSAPGTTLDSKTVSFVDATNWDYHLASGDTAAKDAGTDLSGDANWAFSTDADGSTRSGTWDVGADEYVVAGPGSGSDLGAVQFSESSTNLIRVTVPEETA